ncbi:MAG: hypothetical protein WAM66_00390 [Acidobacteriaceae bacterium]
MATIDFTFPHAWTAGIVPAVPRIPPKWRYVYPRFAEDVERGALEAIIRPTGAEGFLGTFALGFSDPVAPSGIWSCPNPQWLCAVAGGYAYLVNTQKPDEFTQIEFRPVLEVRALREQRLLLFAGHYAMAAWGENGKAWETARLSSEGVQITSVEGRWLHGVGWDMRTDRDVPFTVNLETGAHTCDAG